MTQIVARCQGVDLPAPPFLNETRIARINYARYEGQEIAGALHVVGAGLDVVGAATAHNCQPATVLSSEANPALLPQINQLYVANALAGRIRVENRVPMTGQDRPETVTFHVHNSHLGSSLIDSDKRETRPVAVPTADFDTTARDFGATVLLMDIEGGELDLLRHADLSPFRTVVLEFRPGTYGVDGIQECKAILRRAGFTRVDTKSSRTVWTCLRKDAA